MEELLKYARLVVREYPTLRDEVSGLVQLCMDEIEAGESEEHEIELCMEDIRQLAKEL